MKKIIVILICCLVYYHSNAQKKYIDLKENSPDKLEFSFQVENFNDWREKSINSFNYSEIFLPGGGVLEEGNPNLPGYSFWIAIPFGKEAVIKTSVQDSIIIE